MYNLFCELFYTPETANLDLFSFAPDNNIFL